jgi:lipoprotein NlpD
MKTISTINIVLLSLLLAACSSTPNKAPVIERSTEQPQVKVTQTPKKTVVKSNANSKDWRPDNYTVKKGDTLYSIGLEFGYDYKEIAQNNNIEAPYNIRVGQQLNIKTSNTSTNASKATEAGNDDVVIKPLNNDNQITPSQNSPVSPVSSANILVINSPKALREPYSEQAAKSPPNPIKAMATKAPEPPAPEAKLETKPEAKPTESKPVDSAISSEDGIDWGLPTKGKIKNGFNEGPNAKGIDIEGRMGQDINASGNGKVIYNGSAVRGYGNLVIVKHNKDYLSVYAHNSKNLVKEGQTVTKGQKIAEMGNSDTDSVKLHFEIRYQGKSVDPTKFLTGL